jgi:hypothetical protein
MITRFFDNCSCISITFSTPLTIKYPPGSYIHSFNFVCSSSDLPFKIHLLLRNIIGIRPICTPFFVTLSNLLLFLSFFVCKVGLYVDFLQRKENFTSYCDLRVRWSVVLLSGKPIEYPIICSYYLKCAHIAI